MAGKELERYITEELAKIKELRSSSLGRGMGLELAMVEELDLVRQTIDRVLDLQQYFKGKVQKPKAEPLETLADVIYILDMKLENLYDDVKTTAALEDPDVQLEADEEEIEHGINREDL